MNRTTKLILDIVMGTVIPILILNNLTGRVGGPTAYVIAALVPVAWVFFDLFFLTRKFNFITSYVGLSAVINGIVAFWFVDGVLYAIKDNLSLLVTTLLFAASLFISRPIFRFFFAQAVNPDTPAKEASLAELMAQSSVARNLRLGTIIVVVQNLLAAALNFYLNLQIVTASFGTEAFNQQVAQVNGLTRIILPIPGFIAFGLGIWLVYRAVYRLLPSEGDKPQLESDFWELVRMREQSGASSQ